MARPTKNGRASQRIQPAATTTTQTRKDSGLDTRKLFTGMAFAVSFQSKRPGESADQYNQRLAQSQEVEKMIQEAGGHLLPNGFDELFQPTALSTAAPSPRDREAGETTRATLTLTAAAQSLGFTALVADGHSRKVKYMQALALGLPCISDRWVTTCLEKKKVVDWMPYLLCAGQSAFLRDAIRSRHLVPYPAGEARLAEVVERRDRLLHGSRILLVMKRSRQEEKKMPYVFLAHVLGAALSRAYSVEEAKEMMRQGEMLGAPFDWVYVDEKTGTEDGLYASGRGNDRGTSRKRKRGNTGSALPAPKRIRTLSDELVIQSLILGRMIDEGELGG